MGSRTVSPEADRGNLGGRRMQAIVLPPENDPRLEALTAFSVIALLSLGLWSTISLAFGSIMYKAIGVILILTPAFWLALQMLLSHP